MYEPQDGQKTRQEVIDKLLDTVRTWAASVGVTVNKAQAASEPKGTRGAGTGGNVIATPGAARGAVPASVGNANANTNGDSDGSNGNSSGNSSSKAARLAVGDGGVQLRIFGSTRLGVHAPDADIDVLCLAPCWLSRGDFFTSLRTALEARPDVCT